MATGGAGVASPCFSLIKIRSVRRAGSPERSHLALNPDIKERGWDDFGSFLISGDFSDVTFIVKEDGSRVKAHKTILSCRSPVFSRMLTTNMKEGRTWEIEVDDIGALALKMFLRYLYGGLLLAEELKTDIELCKELVNAGSKYELPNLKENAALAMAEFVSYKNVLELCKFAKLHGAKAAENELRYFWNANSNKILDSLLC